MAEYLPRVIDGKLNTALQTSGAVVVKGARATGKTRSARQQATSELDLDRASSRATLARQQPSTALEGETPRLLDEWQLVPALWNEVRRAVDDRRSPGQFILTGSAAPNDDAARHPGAGRFTTVTMRTMTLAETGHSNGAISLGSLLNGHLDAIVEAEVSFSDVVERVVNGGWPGWFDQSAATCRARAHAYLEEIAEHDLPTVGGSRRDPRRFRAYLRALAALESQPASFAALTRRMQDEFSAAVGPTSAQTMHDVAERMFLVEDQPAWSPRLRSRQAAAQAPTRHLADPSLAASLLDAGVDRLLAEPETLGFLFESQVVHDLRVYAQSLGTRGVFHYRDTKGRDEIDVVIEAQGGNWIGLEVKLGAAQVDAAAANLLRVAAKIERPAAALAVVTPTGIAHRREDGVMVVPLSVLGV
ncbi:Uncharacterised protein [Actinomyces bovis]|uniref:DUF4143 domain-containing protein n=1 Tax=Actinomyces bovis TaxID=1658 RepID=A0ABY1VRI4_9ACTO|nr:DUF4143 domain-containing protein [Actinomyces bovis]SPT54276.1 Uncharacterised protein [Actinomyces bovis]VEG56402.1 Uncharacterised protein [Actinomyces israelii]